ncbi:acetylglutamate kinase [Flavobacterium columnare ATCC 49512]|uniref:Acetylglutamate kinase n=1 Tax=Flavobacterium columnare (strain ATCC 49512 / CIP 103533 / TG 44/87) TaxID=1041826 RepID=G8X9I0_FLACA|nr:acetylglutamate kinase [Flavobacterium columnare]AEW86543.1 acetylglutamate kinase [Flavobacterium columnare ATCC 49512]
MVHVIKIGGNIIDDAIKLDDFLNRFAKLDGPKILIHGGGKLATSVAKNLNIEQQIIDGRRITDTETLKITAMVYAGLVNKTIVAKLQSKSCNAIGLSGVDGNCIQSVKRNHPTIDYGWVGDVESIHAGFLQNLIDNRIVPVISPITHDGKGNLLNTNADTIATEVAIALSETNEVNLRFCFEKLGVLTNPEVDGSWLRKLDKKEYQSLKEAQIISKGMLPKLENAFKASESKITRVEICHADYASEQGESFIGTLIV